jgi:uncharacterized protein
MSTKIEIIKSQKLKNPLLIVGLPGIGLVGKIAVDYLVNELKPKAKIYAKVISDSFPPAVHTKNGVLELISDDIYLYRSKKRDYLFLIGPVQPSLMMPISSSQHYEFSETISSFLKKQGVKEIYTFAGINVGPKRLNTTPSVIAVSSDLKTKEKLKKLKINNLLFDETKTDALISGVAGLLVGVAYNNYRISGCCFMGETDQKLVFGDQGSAKNVLQVISKLVDFKFDMKKMDKEAKKIETSFSEISNKIKDIEQKKDAPVRYIR